MKNLAQKGLKFDEDLIFEKSASGKRGYSWTFANINALNLKDILDEKYIREEIKDFPELSENEVVRHFTRLSQLNYGVDSGFYPLGSCTMKYNPKINEEVARLRGFRDVHPYFPEELTQGALEIMWNLQEDLKSILGFDAISLQPSAGAHSEFTGMKLIAAYHKEKENNKDTIIIPDSAHGTNPASAVLAGFKVKEVKTGVDGYLTLEKIKDAFDDKTAGIMLTNPNTLGIYEKNIKELIEYFHENDALVYMDGANMNALLGKLRPGDIGVDVMHINLHKTFSTPHGGGGPGSGPVLINKKLEKYLPIPLIVKNNDGFSLNYNSSSSVGRVRSFMGNFLVNLRAYTYILEMGDRGLKQVTEDAVLSANYIKESLKDYYHLPYEGESLHEVVFSDKSFSAAGIKTLDIAKRLIDYGIHPPTVYFPLIVHGAMMIEPTETESKHDIDYFIEVMKKIASEIKERNIGKLVEAPENSSRKRLDEVKAAKDCNLRWKKISEDE